MKDALEDRWEDLGHFIREQRQLGRMSLRKLSEVAGISNPYLSQIERGLRKPSAEILQQIAKALRISAETLYVRAGILEERLGSDDVELALLSDTRISEDQKQTLLKVYRSFVLENGAKGADELGAPEEPTVLMEAPPGGSASAGEAPVPG